MSAHNGTAKRRKRSATRLFAVQALYQMELTGQGFDSLVGEFATHRFGAMIDEDEYEEGDQAFLADILREAVSQQALIDQMTDRALAAAWPLGRIDTVLRALFRAAGGELTAKDTPPKVVITEYVDVAKAFFPEGREGGFVNAVLDHMAREARPEAF